METCGTPFSKCESLDGAARVEAGAPIQQNTICKIAIRSSIFLSWQRTLNAATCFLVLWT
jgi:hypothetical protein